MIRASIARALHFLRRIPKRKVARVMALIAVFAFLTDWLSKSWALDRVNEVFMPLGALTLGVVRNEGFALSTGEGTVSVALVAIVRLAVLAGFLIVAQRGAELLSRRDAYGVALIAAGGFGNLNDLLFRGSVVDFIGAGPFVIDWADAPLHMHVVFNTADLFIIVGIVMMAPFIHVLGAKIQDWINSREHRILFR